MPDPTCGRNVATAPRHHRSNHHVNHTSLDRQGPPHAARDNRKIKETSWTEWPGSNHLDPVPSLSSQQPAYAASTHRTSAITKPSGPGALPGLQAHLVQGNVYPVNPASGSLDHRRKSTRPSAGRPRSWLRTDAQSVLRFCPRCGRRRLPRSHGTRPTGRNSSHFKRELAPAKHSQPDDGSRQATPSVPRTEAPGRGEPRQRLVQHMGA